MTARRRREVWDKVDTFFRSALDHPSWVEWRREAALDYAYKENEQYTPAELAELRRRGQPPTTENQIKVTVDRLVGGFIRQRTQIKFRGRNDPQDADVANVLSDIVRYVHQSQGLEFEERDQFEDGVTGGFGCLYVDVTHDDVLQPELTVQRVDPFELFPDPWSKRYDWNHDARFICWAKWTELDEALTLYPRARKHLMALAGGTESYDPGGTSEGDALQNRTYVDFDADGRVRRVRLVEAWWVEYESEPAWVLGEGHARRIFFDAGLSPADRRLVVAQGGRQIQRVRRVPHRTVFTADQLLLTEVERDPHGFALFPFIPLFDRRRENGCPYSSIRTARTLQDAINKRGSKALHLMTATQTIVEENAVRDLAHLATEIAKPDGIVEVKKLDKIKLERHVDVGSAQFQMHTDAKHAFRQVTGVNPEALGERSEVRSGVGIARKQAMTETVVAPSYDNVRRTRRIYAQVLLGFVRSYYTPGKVLLITDDLGGETTRVLDQGVLYQIKTGHYDVVVDEVPDFTTVQQEQVAMIGELLTRLPLGDPRLPLLIEMSDLRHKEDLLKRIAGMTQPPPPQPRISLQLDWKELTPAEKAAFAKLMGLPELVAAQDEGKEPNSEIQRDTALRKESMRGQLEHTKLAVDFLRGAMDGARAGEHGGAEGGGGGEEGAPSTT